MVRQPINKIDLKKLKMAKEVMAVLEVLGISESDLDDILTIKALKAEIDVLRAKIEELEQFKEKTIKAERLEASGGKTQNAQEALKNILAKPAEEFNLNGRR